MFVFSELADCDKLCFCFSGAMTHLYRRATISMMVFRISKLTDIYSPEKRSSLMSGVRSKNTSGELSVRKALHQMGLRFRLHRQDLPGKPDIVLPKFRTVVFVHGCFWHVHKHCRKSSLPQNNRVFWQAKLERNVERDQQNILALEAQGWKVMVIWECQARNSEKLRELLQSVFFR